MHKYRGDKELSDLLGDLDKPKCKYEKWNGDDEKLLLYETKDGRYLLTWANYVERASQYVAAFVGGLSLLESMCYRDKEHDSKTKEKEKDIKSLMGRAINKFNELNQFVIDNWKHKIIFDPRTTFFDVTTIEFMKDEMHTVVDTTAYRTSLFYRLDMRGRELMRDPNFRKLLSVNEVRY